MCKIGDNLNNILWDEFDVTIKVNALNTFVYESYQPKFASTNDSEMSMSRKWWIFRQKRAGWILKSDITINSGSNQILSIHMYRVKTAPHAFFIK